jgi:hypothetical protein
VFLKNNVGYRRHLSKALTFNMKYMTLRTALPLAFSATLFACAQLEPSGSAASSAGQRSPPRAHAERAQRLTANHLTSAKTLMG